MIKRLITIYNEKLGPGLMFAAVAVGVSHLVQSTRAGANYGLTLSWLIIFSCLIKYPAFRFGSDYAATTGKSLLHAYKQQGRMTLLIFLFGLPLDMFVVTAALAIVTAGIFKNVLFVDINDVWLSFIILACVAGLLVSGRYSLFENITKFIVVLFSILTVIAATLAVPELHWQTNDLTADIHFDEATILFMIAIAGWMPTGISVAVYQSFWVCEKARSLEQPADLEATRFDFDIGYFGSIFLALCFVLMGTALMYNAGISVKPSPAGFASQLIDMFTQVLGVWTRPMIAVAAFAVMISTILTSLDACPRIAESVVKQLAPSIADRDFNLKAVIMMAQVLGATLILLLFMKSFKSFIDFATSVAFVSAPILSWFNHRAIYSSAIEPSQQPGMVIRIWSLLGIVIMFAVAAYYLNSKLFHVWA